MHRAAGHLTDSYLNIGNTVIAAAEITGAEAIHPGYGFLAENAHFAEDTGGVQAWRGSAPGLRPFGRWETRRMPVSALQWRSRRASASQAATDPLASAAEARDAWQTEVGYPVILKASAGGGGRGMRIVEQADELESPIHGCQRGGDVGRLATARCTWKNTSPHASARRVSDLRRPSWQRHPSRRARVLDPTASSEVAGGVAFGSSRSSRCVTEMGAAAVSVWLRSRGLRKRWHR